MINILFIVEGEKQDPALMEHLLETYIGERDLEYQMSSYGTCIYDLYDKVFKDNDDEEDIDLLLTLKSREKDEDKKKIFDKDYTDIVLIFDLDPHDGRYDKEKIRKMQRYFNDTTDKGKLYINYPMVEAFKHTETKNRVKESFKEIKANVSDLKNYKQRVIDEGRYLKYPSYTKDTCDKIIIRNIKKGRYIIGKNYDDDITEKEYLDMDLMSILNKQIEMIEKDNSVFVLCTCAFFIADFAFGFINTKI